MGVTFIILLLSIPADVSHLNISVPFLWNTKSLSVVVSIALVRNSYAVPTITFLWKETALFVISHTIVSPPPSPTRYLIIGLSAIGCKFLISKILTLLSKHGFNDSLTAVSIKRVFAKCNGWSILILSDWKVIYVEPLRCSTKLLLVWLFKLFDFNCFPVNTVKPCSASIEGFTCYNSICYCLSNSTCYP